MAKEIILNNSQFGRVFIEENKIITFPQGIIGFEDLKRYAILVFEEYQPFQFLISVEDPEISFPVMSPILVNESYSPNISKDEVSLIGDFKDEDLIMYVIVSIKGDITGVTANLKGPIIINQVERLGQQIILESEEYLLDEKLF